MKIFPRNNLYGEFVVPTDRSITNRAIMLGAIAKGKTRIVNPFVCEDTQTLLSCVKKAGAKVGVKKNCIEIKSPKRLKLSQKFDCGNSATAMRFLCGAAAGYGGRTVLTGSKSLNKKPMRELKEPLERAGATVALTNYVSAPILVESNGVRSVECDVEIGNSQVKAAVLLCALLGGVKAEVREKFPSRNHLEILMKEMGASVTIKDDGRETFFGGGELTGKTIAVSRDFTFAAHYLALGLLAGRVICRNVNINPTRITLLSVLTRMGAKITVEEKKALSGERTADIIAEKSNLKATHVSADEACLLGDELPLLAFIMGLADGESIISASFAKFKEIAGGGDSFSATVENCLDAVADAINTIGGTARKFDGGVVVSGVERYTGGTIKTRGYPLVAMGGAIALTLSAGGGDIVEDFNADMCGDFFRELFKNSFAMVCRRENDSFKEELYSYALVKAGFATNSCTAIFPVDDNFRKVSAELKNYDGYAVFSPYIYDVSRRLYTLKKHAKTLKTANVVVRGAGYSTNGEAVISSLKYFGFPVSSKRVLVLGCGGLGKSVAYALIEERALVDVYDVNPKQALDFKKLVNENLYVIADVNSSAKYDLVINTAYQSEAHGENINDRDIKAVTSCSAFIDLFGVRADTPLTAAAKKAGVKVLCGSVFSFIQAFYAARVLAGKDLNEKIAFATYERYKDTEL